MCKLICFFITQARCVSRTTLSREMCVHCCHLLHSRRCTFDALSFSISQSVRNAAVSMSGSFVIDVLLPFEAMLLGELLRLLLLTARFGIKTLAGFKFVPLSPTCLKVVLVLRFKPVPLQVRLTFALSSPKGFDRKLLV